MVERQNKLQNQYECTSLLIFRVNIVCWTKQKRHKKEIRGRKIKRTVNERESKWKKCNFSNTKIVKAEKIRRRKKSNTKRKINVKTRMVKTNRTWKT